MYRFFFSVIELSDAFGWAHLCVCRACTAGIGPAFGRAGRHRRQLFSFVPFNEWVIFIGSGQWIFEIKSVSCQFYFFSRNFSFVMVDGIAWRQLACSLHKLFQIKWIIFKLNICDLFWFVCGINWILPIATKWYHPSGSWFEKRAGLDFW